MKRIAFAILIVMTAISAMGRDNNTAFLKTGIGFSGMDFGEMSTCVKPSFHIGGGYEMALNSRWSVVPEFALSFQGAIFDTDKSPEAREYFETERNLIPISGDVKWNAIYFALPVSMRYYATSKFAIDFGAQLCINVDNSLKMDDTEVTKRHRTFETFDAGLLAGVTFYPSERFFVQARGYQGFVKVFKWVEFPKVDKPAGNKNLDNRIFNVMLSVGYEF